MLRADKYVLHSQFSLSYAIILETERGLGNLVFSVFTMIKRVLKLFLPKVLISFYHRILAFVAMLIYRNPSKHLTVIGVTGTNGKSSTVEYIGRILESAGHKVGWTSTTGFKVGKREWVNDQKMTMLGRFQTQKLLRDMVKDGCEYAVVETSSQGVLQSRHRGINYNVAVFTNLTPEHIEAHGGFENYKKAKADFFSLVAKQKDAISIVNIDDANAAHFLSFPFSKQYGFGIDGVSRDHETIISPLQPIIASDVDLKADGSSFTLLDTKFVCHPIGLFNIYNILAAAVTAHALGVPMDKIQSAVRSLKSVPGRLESVNEGQDFHVIVDYAPEPAALNATYAALNLLKRNRLIHILGSTGGGRDKARRSILGSMAAKEADIVIVTNEDPYDEDPMQIIQDVADGAEKGGKVRRSRIRLRRKKEQENLFLIPERRTAIETAMQMAEPGDLVLITGKGNEPVMCVAGGKKIPSDDRQMAREAIGKRFSI